MSLNDYPEYLVKLGEAVRKARAAVDRIVDCNREFYRAEGELRDALIKLQSDKLTRAPEFAKALERCDRMRELESTKDISSISIPLDHALTEAWRKLP